MKNKEEINKSIDNIQNELISKCDFINKWFPNLESQIEVSKNNINYTIKMLIDTNNEIDNLFIINAINIIKDKCNIGMKKLESIYKNNLNINNNKQNEKFFYLYNELKKLFKLPTKTFEEIQTKLHNIDTLLNQIDDFQNEISGKKLYKKRK